MQSDSDDSGRQNSIDLRFELHDLANTVYQNLEHIQTTSVKDKYPVIEAWLGLGLSIELVKERVELTTESALLKHIQKYRILLSKPCLPHEAQAYQWSIDCVMDMAMELSEPNESNILHLFE